MKAHLPLCPLEKRRTYVSSGKATRVSRLSCSVSYKCHLRVLNLLAIKLEKLPVLVKYKITWALCQTNVSRKQTLQTTTHLKLWKTVFNLTSFQTPQMQSDSICLQVFPTVPRFVFAETFLIFIAAFHFHVWSSYFYVSLNLAVFPTVWILINFVTQLFKKV